MSVWNRMEGDALVRTVCLSLAVAAVATALCWPLGYRVVRSGGRWRVLWPVAILPLAISPAILGIALILLWNRGGAPEWASHAAWLPDWFVGLWDGAGSFMGWVYGSPSILVIGGLARFAPVALLAAAGATARVPVELEQAAALDGATRTQVVCRIVFPLSSGFLAAGFVAVFVLMMGESGVSFLLRPAGWSTYPIIFMDLVHFGFVELLSALALVQLVVCLAPALAAALLILRRSA